MPISEEEVWKALRSVIEPDSGRDIASLNMVREVGLAEDGTVSIKLVVPPQAAPGKAAIEADIKRAVILLSGVKKINIDSGGSTTAPPKPGDALRAVRNIIAVASCKGGVGKSTVALNLALALQKSGARVGILDADIYGPNLPLMTGLLGEQITVRVTDDGAGTSGEIMEPMEKYGLKIMSLGFLIHEGQPVVWRGPMLNSAMRQFLTQVDWGQLDYLVIDLPPGTGDVQLTLLQMVKVTGVVHVTTPQDVALQDVRRGVAMFDGMKVPTLGIVENMSAFECPNCGVSTPVFSSGGGSRMAESLEVPFLGAIPLDTFIRVGGDTGRPVTESAPDSIQADIFRKIASKVASQLSGLQNDTSKPEFAQAQL